MAKKINTTPAPEFAIPAEHAELPQKLFSDAKSPEEAFKKLEERFVFLSSTATVDRKLTEPEVEDIRQNYTTLVENERVEAKNKLRSVLANNEILKKQMKSDQEAAESVLAGVETEIDDHVRMIKRGVADMELEGDKSFRIAADGKYLYYTWTGDGFTLAKVEQIPFMHQGELFSSQDKNQEALTALFGIEFGEARFEEVAIDYDSYESYIGRKLGAAAVRTWMEDFVDEDTGTIVQIERHDKADVEVNSILTNDDLREILDTDIRSIVLYKVAATQAETSEEAESEPENE